ncbi:MAG: hypothetical protein IMZ47_02195 [Firmicutes bacterium]|nr:hypothetical protein [Bacillota bacterium]
MVKSNQKFYLTSLGVLLVLSAYPLVMGMKIVILQLLNGSIRPEDYARYVIPYTAICLSILISVAMYPLISKLKRLSNLVATGLGLGLFVGIELFMENITLNSPEAQNTLTMQLVSCIGSTAAQQAFQKLYDNTFKIHYFLISFVIIVLIIGLVYGYGRITGTGNRSNRPMLRLQLITTAFFLFLCIYANFTGFFRETTQYLSPLSAFLTSIYFIVLGVTFGIYVGSHLVNKSKVFSIGIPTIAAILVCSIMYYGEYKLLNGILYQYGSSSWFQPIPNIALSIVDLIIILTSGVITAILMSVSEKSNSINKVTAV